MAKWDWGDGSTIRCAERVKSGGELNAAICSNVRLGSKV